jgi:hypothetical protein
MLFEKIAMALKIPKAMKEMNVSKFIIRDTVRLRPH